MRTVKLLNEKVNHIKFGVGRITEEKEDGRLSISFEKEGVGTKVFDYPEAFERFLKFDSVDLQKMTRVDLKKLEEEKEAEAQREREKQARIERYKKQFMEQFLRNQRAQASK